MMNWGSYVGVHLILSLAKANKSVVYDISHFQADIFLE